MVIYAEPTCPSCERRFVLTCYDAPPARPVLPLHYLTVQINAGEKGWPVYRQGTTSCPLSGAYLDELVP